VVFSAPIARPGGVEFSTITAQDLVKAALDERHFVRVGLTSPGLTPLHRRGAKRVIMTECNKHRRLRSDRSISPFKSAMAEACVGVSAFAAAASSVASVPPSASSSSERVQTQLYEQRLGDGTIKDFRVTSTQSFFSPLLDSSVAAYLGLVLLYQVWLHAQLSFQGLALVIVPIHPCETDSCRAMILHCSRSRTAHSRGMRGCCRRHVSSCSLRSASWDAYNKVGL
jgi:hypothetical protein